MSGINPAVRGCRHRSVGTWRSVWVPNNTGNSARKRYFLLCSSETNDSENQRKTDDVLPHEYYFTPRPGEKADCRNQALAQACAFPSPF
jgi:hypothetical protein